MEIVNNTTCTSGTLIIGLTHFSGNSTNISAWQPTWANENKQIFGISPSPGIRISSSNLCLGVILIMLESTISWKTTTQSRHIVFQPCCHFIARAHGFMASLTHQGASLPSSHRAWAGCTPVPPSPFITPPATQTLGKISAGLQPHIPSR